MTTVPLYTYKLLNSQNQLEIGLLNHLAQQVRMIFIFNIEFFSTFINGGSIVLFDQCSLSVLSLVSVAFIDVL